MTWNEFSSGNTWQTAGAMGANDSTVAIATGVDPGANNTNTPWAGGTGLDVTVAANSWLNLMDTTQLGFLISYETFSGQNTATYGTKEGSGLGPVLEVEFAFVPEPASGVC